MNRSLSIILSVLPHLLLGQYTYFNNGYLPPYSSVGSGYSLNMIDRDDTLFTFGFAPFPDENGRSILAINSDGELLENYLFPEGNVIQSMDYSDAITITESGFIHSGGQLGYPMIMWLNDMFQELFRIDYEILQTDTTYGEYFTNCAFENNTVVSTGRLIYDLEPEVPGQDFANLILSKHDADGNEIWFHEYTLEDLNVTDDNLYSIFPRGGITPLPNGDFLVWCTISEPSDCYAFKFDSLGNYVDHVSWGHPTYSDGSAWPVQISENEFMFAYSHPVSYVFDYVTTKPRVGILNTDDMSVDLFPVLDYPQEFGGITDFEKTPDGDFVILGYGGPDIQGEIIYAYMLRIDTMGEVVWFKTYTPPDFSYELNAYDLEITSDGGFAFVGNYHPYDQGVFYYKTWVVKTDACGDLMDAGCEPIIQISELQNKHETLSVYPNPVQDVLTISYENAGIASLELYDANGRLMLRQKVNDQAIQHYLNVGELPSSLYELRLINQFGATMESVVVIKK